MKKYISGMITVLFFVPFVALAVNITVPSAPGAGFALISTTTGAYVATTTNPFQIGSLFASTTATSTFNGGIRALLLNITGIASSTFANGINLLTGCLAYNGTCITQNAGTVTSVNNGSTGSTLTFSGGPITTNGTINGEINLTHSNAWIALQTFSNSTSTLFSCATNCWFNALGTPAGTFLAVDPNGKLIATSTPAQGTGTVTNIATTYPVTGGPITTTGTIALAFGTTTANTWSALQIFNGGASSTVFSVSNGSATSTILATATSTFAAGVSGTYFSATGLTASSTFANGIVLNAGCILVNGTCLTSNTGTVTSVAAGTGIGGGTITTTGTHYLLSYLATSSAETRGQVAAFSSTNATPATLYGTATTTLSGTANQISISNSPVVLGASGAVISFPSLVILGQASTTLFSSYGPAYFGATATSSFTTAGGLTMCATCTLILPNGTAPSPSTTGAGAIQTTAASSSFTFYDGTAQRYLFPETGFIIPVATTTAAAGTTTKKFSAVGRDWTATQVTCTSQDAGTWNVQFGNGTASTTMVATDVGATQTFTALASNNTFTFRQSWYMAYGTPSATSNSGFSCTLMHRYTN